MSEHTPIPWHVVHIGTKSDPPLLRIQARYGNPSMDDSQLAPVRALGEGVNAEANAAYIVRCVNSHADLLAALRKIEEMPWPGSESPYAVIARAAIEKEGRKP